MIFIDEFPRCNGATDNMDSAMLAGMMAVTQHPRAISCTKYKIDNWTIVRCPIADHDGDWCQNPNNVTLDQLIPIIAGLWVQGRNLEAKMLCKSAKERGWLAQNFERDKPGSTKYPYPHFYEEDGKRKFKLYDGPDRVWCAQREFMKNILYDTCEDYWLEKYIKFHAYLTPLKESNQLTAMMLASVSPKMYVTQWRFHNTRWRECVRDYYCAPARNEPRFAEHVVGYLEGL